MSRPPVPISYCPHLIPLVVPKNSVQGFLNADRRLFRRAAAKLVTPWPKWPNSNGSQSPSNEID